MIVCVCVCACVFLILIARIVGIDHQVGGVMGVSAGPLISRDEASLVD